MPFRRLLVLTAVGSLALVGCSSDDPAVDVDVDEALATAQDVESELESEAEEVLSEVEEIGSEASEAVEAASEAVDAEASEGDGRTGVQLVATLTGTAEVPGPGDPGGSGSFAGELTFLEASGELCYALDAVGLTSEPVAAHIHAGAEGESGPVALALTAPTDGVVEECIPVDAGLATMLDQNPSDYYVNVHSAEFGDGAIRGQLEQ